MNVIKKSQNNKKFIVKVMNIVFVLLILLLVDLIWISFFMRSRYKTFVRKLQGSEIKVNYIAAGFTYILMALSVVYLLQPLIKNKGTREAYLLGGMMGLTVYGIYAGTLKAVLPSFSNVTMGMDIIWGIFLYSLATFLIRN